MRFMFEGGSVEQALADRTPIAHAATAALNDVVALAKRQGRANIASAGFGARWQNGLQAKIFPGSGDSLNAAALLFHKIPYAGIFEEGGTIRGQPLLWLPLEKNLPVRSAGRPWTPARYAREVGRLVSVNKPGKPPMLFAADGRRVGASLKPLFVGVPAVHIAKRFDLVNIFAAAAGHLGERYLAHLDDVN